VSPWNAAQGGMVAFWWERKSRDRDPGKNPSMYRKEPRTGSFSTGRICSRAVALSFVIIAHTSAKTMSTNSLRANKFAQWKTRFILMSFQVHQVTIPIYNLDIQYIAVLTPIYDIYEHVLGTSIYIHDRLNTTIKL
jgi:hypothetical protein